MTWLAIKLFAGGLLKRLWEAATALLGWAGRNPWQAAVIALLIALAWTWHGKNKANARADRAEAATAQCINEGKKNRAAAIAQVKATEAKFEKAAKETDDAHSKELAQAMSATDRYAAANRVRPKASSVRPADPASEGQAAAVLEVPTAAAELVSITADDLKICTANSVYAKSAFNFGQALISAGLAE